MSDSTIVRPRVSGKIVPSDWQRVLSELVGTMFFVYAVSASVVIPMTYLQASPGVTSLVTALIQGLSLIAIVSIFAGVSGSHFNPAITLMTMLTAKIGIFLGIFYIIAQLIGAILGAALFRGSVTNWQQAHLSATTIGPGVSLGQAFLIEFMITSILLLVVIGTSTDTRQGFYILAPIPIGFAVLIGVLIARTLTGASMNPARSFGPAVVSNTWTDNWLYWAAPFTASLFVSILYLVLFRVRVGGRSVPLDTEVGAANAAATGSPVQQVDRTF